MKIQLLFFFFFPCISVNQIQNNTLWMTLTIQLCSWLWERKRKIETEKGKRKGERVGEGQIIKY